MWLMMWLTMWLCGVTVSGEQGRGDVITGSRGFHMARVAFTCLSHAARPANHSTIGINAMRSTPGSKPNL
jgi:hypothetical protein